MSKNTVSQKALSILLCFTMILSVFGVDTAGASAAVNDSGVKNSGIGAMRNGAPVTLYLDSGDIVITETGYSVGGGTEVACTGGYVITQDGNGDVQHTITIKSGTQDITVENININVSGTSNACAFSIEKGAAVYLTLEGNNTLKSGDYCAGLQVPGDAIAPADTTKNASLTVTDASTGSLNATGGRYGAGIGGGYGGRTGGAGGAITVTGGTVTATGNYGAGIGGGYNDAGGTITVTGGTVTATGNYAAGIGGGWAGGWDFSDCSVTISGGSVTAIGGTGGAGIGSSGGTNCAGIGVTISGGSVTATGGKNAAGIGGGEGSMGDTVKISGTGTFVTAKGNGGKDIGSGNGNNSGGSLSVLDGATMTMQNTDPNLNTNAVNPDYRNCQIITGGTETKYDKDGNVSSTQRILHLDDGNIVITGTGYSVGGGTEVDHTGGYVITQNGNGDVHYSITVSSGTQDITLQDVHARPAQGAAFEIESGAEAYITLAGSNSLDTSGSSSHRAGLAVNAGNTVHISGSGSLTAAGGDTSAGIGGNNGQSCGTVEISGGTVTATGGVDGAGIGGGSNGSGGNITISGGTVIANGVNQGAGIGGGISGSGGTITISGGTVTATGGSVTANGCLGGAGIGGGFCGSSGTVTISGADTLVTAKGQGGGRDIGSGDNNNTGGTLTVGDSNTAEPLPNVELLSAGTNAANPGTSRPQFMNCVIQGTGAKDASGNDISGCYDKNGKLWLDITMQTPSAVKVGESVALNASVKRHYFNDTVTLPGTVQFTGGGNLFGSSPVTLGAAQISWTPANGNKVSLKAAYVPATDDRYASAESAAIEYTPVKITPVIGTAPTASPVKAGEKLSASKLTGGTAAANGKQIPGAFSWAHPDTAVTASGSYEAIFTPTDTATYNTVNGIPVAVTVAAAPSSGSHSSSTSAPSLPSSLTDATTHITVDLSGATFPSWVTGVSLSASPFTQGGSSGASDAQGGAVYRLVISQTGLNLIGSPFVYNIQLLDQSGSPVTYFTGTVTVRIPLPAGLRGTPRVFRYESDGTLTDMNAAVENGFLVFQTTHFSDYVVAGTGDSITLDTKDYSMPVGGKYQIGVKLTGTKAAAVKFHSTNDKTATVAKLKNGNYQVTGNGPGTAYIMFDVYDNKNKLLTHASVRVDVKTGIRPRGDSTRQIGVF
ncbi:beta strand repeat-containing protein [Caproicibacter sp.]|uniref:beta strand repeat-containing protein n=1 Tax=Caproicibacter sp. TaxID=2814884 RepID=UPI00398975E3